MQLCVLGEHTDWAAGYRDRTRNIPPGFTLVATTQEGIHARVSGRRDGRFVFKTCTSPSVDLKPFSEVPLDVPMTEEVGSPLFRNFCETLLMCYSCRTVQENGKYSY